MKENTLEERFNKAWKFGVDDTQKKANMKAFIEAEKELSRQEGLDEGLATANKGKLYEIVVEKAKQEAYKEVVKMAEEMEDEYWAMENGRAVEVCQRIINRLTPPKNNE